MLSLKRIEIFIAVFVFVILKLVLYIFDKEKYFSGEFATYRYLVSISLTLYFLYKFKQEIKHLKLIDVFLFTFVSVVGIGLSGLLIDVLVYNYLDNSWLKDAIEMEYSAQKSELESMNATGDLDRDKIEQDMIEQFSAWGLLKSFLYSLPFLALLSLLIGTLFQSRED
jgi:Protein of unknown function (DUF4199)